MADAVAPPVPPTPEQLHALEEAQYFIFVAQIFFCSMYAVVVWDWIVSLPREWKFIWKSRWSVAKASYLFCRYWPILVVPYILSVFVTNHTQEECEKIYRSPVSLATWNQAGAEVVLLIRTYAFFNRNKYLLVTLCICFAGVLGYQLFVDINEMLLLPFASTTGTGPCLPMSRPHSAHILGFFMASLAFDAIVTSLTLFKAIRIRRMCGGTSSPLIQTFLREGVFYFVLISIANLVNGIFYLQPKAVMSAINIPLSIMFPDVLACRLILDLRERGFEISQPTIQATLPTSVNVTGRTGATSSILRPSPAQMKFPNSSTTLSLASIGGDNNNAKGRGLRGFMGRKASASALTTTINSTIFSSSHQTSSGSGASAARDTSLELSSFPARHTASASDEEEKPVDEIAELGYVPYQGGQSHTGTGVRIDVEKTTSM